MLLLYSCTVIHVNYILVCKCSYLCRYHHFMAALSNSYIHVPIAMVVGIIQLKLISSGLSFTVEQLFPALLYLASEWHSLGEALSLNEYCLAEICINSKTNEDGLRMMLERYMMRSDLIHSWEEIHAAINKVNGIPKQTDESVSTDPQTPPAPGDNLLPGTCNS